MNSSQTLLLVEDDPITGMAEARSLANEGYNVIHVLSGEEAIELFHKKDHAIDLILMDIDLGVNMDGTMAAQEILKAHDIPVVFLSSHTENEIVEKTEKITSYGYVVKNTGITILKTSIKMAFKLHDAHRNIEKNRMEIETANEEMQATVEQLEEANVELERSNKELTQSQKVLVEREKNLKDSEERYRLLVENAGEAIVVAQGNMMKYANPMTSVLFGFSEEELYTRPFLDFIHPEDRGLVAERYQKRVAGYESPSVYQFRILKKEGGFRWVEINVVGFMWEKSPATLNFFTDITARKMAEKELRESEERFRTLIESAPIAIGIARRGVVIYVNQMFASVFGLINKDDMVGRPITDLVAPQDAEAFLNRHRKREEGVIVENFYQMMGQKADGMQFPVVTAATQVNLSDGPATIAFFQDVSKQKQTEEALAKSAMEKEILLREIQHRVKNNLNVVSSLIVLELDKLTDGRSRQVFVDTRSRINSISAIYEQLNRSAILDSVNLARYIKDLVELIFQSYAVQAGTLQVQTSLADVQLDSKRAVPLGIICNELISNAVKNAYPSGAKGEIRIDLNTVEGRLILRVEDDGAGFPPGFDPEKAETMGLRLVGMLVKQLNGTLSIENRKGASIAMAFEL